ncbi:MAG: HAD family hydrolase [Allosphingosinicella sp.]
MFDFDGVIADSEILSNAVLAEALTGLGHPTTTAEAIERYIGLHWADTCAAIEARIGRTLPEAFKADTGAAFASRVDEVVAVPGIHAFLEALPGLPKAVASSSPVSWLRSSLERFGLERHFGAHLYSAAEHVGRGKPYPDIYLHAARALGVEPSKVLVLEDTAPGVKAARAAGMTVVGLCAGTHCGSGYGERLSAAGARRIASTYTEVLEFIER